MIFDKLKNSDTYAFDDNLNAGFEFIKNNDLMNFENGDYEIIPNKVRANVQEYNTKLEGKFEAHRKYMDIQYMIRGSEKMGVVEISNVKPITDYDKEKDVQFLQGEGNTIIVPQGYFTVFYPQDAHMPCLQNEKSEFIKKVVVKILI